MARKIKKIGNVCAFLVLAILCACSSEPKCTSSETIELVEEIIKEQFANSFGQEFASQLKISVESIRTTDSNEKTGAKECAAQLKMKGPGGEEVVDIIYTCELTDKGDEIFVTVYDL